MADWSDTNPQETTPYVSVLPALRDRDKDAYMLAESPTNPPTGAIRYNRSANKFQEWDGASWVDKVISIAGGGTGAIDAASARTALGLGTMAVQNNNAVSITGGSISGLSSLGASVASLGNVTISGTLGVSGLSTFSGNVLVSNTDPFIDLNESDQAADEKRWRITVSAKNLSFQTINDALGSTETGLQIRRGTGINVTQVLVNSANLRIDNGSNQGVIQRPDDASSAITVGNGTNSFFGTQEFYNVAGSTLISKIYDTASSTQERVAIITAKDNLSLFLGDGATTAGYAANEYSGAIRFNGSIVAWGDLAYYPNGGDANEYGHFRFSRSGGAVAPTTLANVGANDFRAVDGFCFVSETSLKFTRSGAGAVSLAGVLNTTGNLSTSANLSSSGTISVGSTGVHTGRATFNGGIDVNSASSTFNDLLSVGSGSPVFQANPGSFVTINTASFTLPALGTGSGTDLIINGTTVQKKSSSIRYKENVEDFKLDIRNFMASLVPIKFDYINSSKDLRGFIAEEVHANYPELVNMNDEGQCESIRLDGLVAYMFYTMRVMYARLLEVDNYLLGNSPLG